MAKEKAFSNALLYFVRRILPIVSTIVIGVALSIAAYLYITDVEKQRVEAEFKQLAAGQATAIRKEIELYINTLGSTRSLYATENVSRTKFHDFTSDILKQYKSTLALMWMPRVKASDRREFELGAERDGLPNFYITERRGDNQYYRAGERQQYFPTYYSDVNNGYDIVLGLDMSNDPAWSDAMMRARNEDHLVAMPYLSATGDGTNDIVVFNPIYQIGLPRETLEQRQKYFFGFTAAIYKLEGLVDNVLKAFKSEGLTIAVFDESASDTRTVLYGKALPPLVPANSGATALDALKGLSYATILDAFKGLSSVTTLDALKGLSYVTTFDIAGRKWSIAATPSAQFSGGKSTPLPRATLAVGLAFTALLTLYFISLVRRTAHVEKLVTDRTAELSAAYQHLKESEAQLIQSEKMASLGQMVAGVAHEINTPLGYVSSTVEMLGERIDIVDSLVGDVDELIKMLTTPGTNDTSLERQFALVSDEISKVRSEGSMEETAQLLKDSIYGLNRIQEIVVGLKDFSRQDRATTGDFDINKGLDQTLLIAQSLLKNRVIVTKHYGKLPNVTGSPSQINQVLLNVIKNAAESIDGSGTIAIKTWRDQDQARISVEDSGCGIAANILPKIFDPFFTTKEVGSGTGLGLSISYKIIKQHGGDIVASSIAGKGSTFVISLPLAATVAIKKMA